MRHPIEALQGARWLAGVPQVLPMPGLQQGEAQRRQEREEGGTDDFLMGDYVDLQDFGDGVVRAHPL